MLLNIFLAIYFVQCAHVNFRFQVPLICVGGYCLRQVLKYQSVLVRCKINTYFCLGYNNKSKARNVCKNISNEESEKLFDITSFSWALEMRQEILNLFQQTLERTKL